MEVEEFAPHVSADEGVEVGGRGDDAPGGPGSVGGNDLAVVLRRLLSWVVIVAVDVGLLELGAGRQGGPLKAQRPVNLLLELVFVGFARGRLDHQGHGYVVRVGIPVLGTGIEEQRRIIFRVILIQVSKQLLRWGCLCGVLKNRVLEARILREVNGHPWVFPDMVNNLRKLFT